jgi:hypothetical protein
MQYPASRNLEPGIVKSSSAARKQVGIFLTKLGSGVALEGGEASRNGAVPPRRPPEVLGKWPDRQTNGGLALSSESHDIYEKAGTYKRFGRFVG